MEITLIRHGQPAWSVQDRFAADPELTEHGHLQARQMGARMASHLMDELWVSDAVRARQTAAPLVRESGITPTVLPWLHELRSDGLDGRPTAEVEALFARTHHGPIQGWWQGVDGGESSRDFVQRVTTGLDNALAEHGMHASTDNGITLWDAAPERHITIVSHAGTSDVVLAHLLGLPLVPWPWMRFGLLHTGIARVETRAVAGAWVFGLASFQDVDHLQTDQITR